MAFFERRYSGRYHISGSRWSDAELGWWTFSGPYTTYEVYYSNCYDRWWRYFDGITPPWSYQPHTNMWFEAPTTAYMHTMDADDYVRIESLDGTRWVECYTRESTRVCHFSCSNASYDDVGVSTPAYSGRTAYGGLIVNVNGTVTYQCGCMQPYSSSCSDSSETSL